MEKKYIKYFAWSAVGVVLSCIIYWSVITYLILPTNCNGERGQFGDMFGAITALFTGLAFAGLIITILLQSQELKETRHEFKQQNRTLIFQRFENTFFNLISVHHQIVDSIDYTYNKKNKKEH